MSLFCSDSVVKTIEVAPRVPGNHYEYPFRPQSKQCSPEPLDQSPNFLSAFHSVQFKCPLAENIESPGTGNVGIISLL